MHFRDWYCKRLLLSHPNPDPDSNTDPNKVTYPIPANDDSMRTINIIISALADAVLEAKGIDSIDNPKIEDNSSKTEQQNNLLESSQEEE